MAAPYWAHLFVRNISKNMSTLGQRTQRKLGELSPFLSSIISQFLDFIHCMVFESIFYCVIMNALYSSNSEA